MILNLRLRLASHVLFLASLSMLVSACSSPSGMSTDPDDERTGTQIAESVKSLSLTAREEALVSEIEDGNVPSWSASYQRITVTGVVLGTSHTVTFEAAVDYLSVGTDDDPFYTPLTPQSAQRIADLRGASLPTSRMVDLIWQEAPVKLAPKPIPPSDQMTTVPVFVDHNEMVNEQLREGSTGNASRSDMIAGHKKDVVLTNRLNTAPGKVAIYGWHQLNGSAIQPVYTGHTDQWVDYSHGIRLIRRVVEVDGVPRDLLDVLGDPGVAPLLSSEGALTFTRYPTD